MSQISAPLGTDVSYRSFSFFYGAPLNFESKSVVKVEEDREVGEGVGFGDFFQERRLDRHLS